ncbi:MAG: hypothetical protein WBA99_00450, partial [Nodosilinea sp.]
SRRMMASRVEGWGRVEGLAMVASDDYVSTVFSITALGRVKNANGKAQARLSPKGISYPNFPVQGDASDL